MPPWGLSTRKRIFSWSSPMRWAIPTPASRVPSTLWFYHEKACYVGLVTLGLIVIGLASRRSLPLATADVGALRPRIDDRDGGNFPLFR